MLNWAGAILRRANLPPDLRVKLEKNGSSRIIILDETVVKPDTLEWRAAQVVFYVESMRRHIESENARDAAWCVMHASGHYWMAFIEDNLERAFYAGRATIEGGKRGQASYRNDALSGELYRLFMTLGVALPPLNAEARYRKIAAERKRENKRCATAAAIKSRIVRFARSKKVEAKGRMPHL